MRRAATALLAAAVVVAAAAPPRRIEVRTSAGAVVWRRGGAPALRVMPRRGDGWYRLARRYCGDARLARRLAAANPGLSSPQRGRPVVVPLTLLRGDLRLEAVRRLFPADGRVRLGWRHWVLDPFGGGEESWELLAELFTGRRRTAAALRRANPEAARRGPARGEAVLIPEAVLLPVFRRVPVPTPTPAPTATPTPTARPTATPAPSPTPTPAAPARPPARRGVPVRLEYGRDARGEYAVYRLRPGEALYSAVVVRFTGQLHAAEVNATAMRIARRSGIRDVTAIPVGYPVKIPLELLLPEYLPPGHPRRVAWERERRELDRWVETVRAADLSGVHVILDAGHGGTDSGAVRQGVWEATYAYDLLCRIKRALETHTRATVWPTILDRSRGYGVPDRDRLIQDRDQVLLTHPRYALADSRLGVHLRWYLANEIVLRQERSGVPPGKIVFLSIHADSLHPSVRGAMVYVPSRRLRPSRFRASARGIGAYREYRSHPTVRLSRRFRTRCEAASLRLARHLVKAIAGEGLAVHPYEPVRDSVLRGRRRWVPAVLRYSLARHAVLLECCNLANPEDRKALLDRRWRERFARAVVAGLAAAFDDGSR